MKPVSAQPPFPQPPSQDDVHSISNWASALTRQLFTYLREIAYRLNHSFTDDMPVVQLKDSVTSVADGEVVVFDGTTGKVIRSGGFLPQQRVDDVFSLEIAAGKTGDRNAFIDFHSDDTNTDYSFRIIRAQGVNGNAQLNNQGAGGIALFANNGIQVGSPTGGFPGNGKVNAVDLEIMGQALSAIFQGKIEIGTWTPTLLGQTTAPTGTLNTGTANYVKIGPVVLLFMGANWTSMTAGSGTFGIGGLPYPVSTSGGGTGLNSKGSFSFSYFSPVGGTAPSSFAGVGGGIISSAFNGMSNLIRVTYQTSTITGINDYPCSAIGTQLWAIGFGMYLTDS